jgi:hypothetical protein
MTRIQSILVIVSFIGYFYIGNAQQCWSDHLFAKLKIENAAQESTLNRFQDAFSKQQIGLEAYQVRFESTPVENHTDALLLDVEELQFIEKYVDTYPKKPDEIIAEIKEEGGYDTWKKNIIEGANTDISWEFMKDLGEDWSKAHKEMLKSDLKKSSSLENAINEDYDLLEIWKVVYDASLPKEIRLNNKGELSVIDMHVAEQSTGDVISVAKEIKDKGWNKWLIHQAGFKHKSIGKQKTEVYIKSEKDILFYYVNGIFFTEYETTFSIDKQIFSGNLFVPKHPKKEEIELEIFKDAFIELGNNKDISEIDMDWGTDVYEEVFKNSFMLFGRNLSAMSPQKAAETTPIGQWLAKQGFEAQVSLADARAIKEKIKSESSIKFVKTIEGSINYKYDNYVKQQLEDFRKFSINSETDICINRVERVARRNDINQLARTFGLDKTIRGEKMWNSDKYYIPVYSNILEDKDKNLPDLILLNEETRKPYEVYVKDGKLYNDKLGDLSGVKVSEESPLIYVMNSRGKIYAGIGIEDVFHHSSFLPKEEKLVTAGQFHYDQVKLTIDVESGHFIPNIESLKDLVEELTIRGVSIWDIQIDN